MKFERLEARDLMTTVVGEESLELRPAGDFDMDGTYDVMVWTHEGGEAYIAIIHGDEALPSRDTIQISTEPSKGITPLLVGRDLDIGGDTSGGIREPVATTNGIGFRLRDGRLFEIDFKHQGGVAGFQLREVSSFEQINALTDFSGDFVRDELVGNEIVFGEPLDSCSNYSTLETEERVAASHAFHIGDVTGDGISDVAVRQLAHWSGLAYRDHVISGFNGAEERTSITPPNPGSRPENPFAVPSDDRFDFNADGLLDRISGLNIIYGQPTHDRDAIPICGTDRKLQLFSVGDFNRDGLDDFMLKGNRDVPWYRSEGSDYGFFVWGSSELVNASHLTVIDDAIVNAVGETVGANAALPAKQVIRGELIDTTLLPGYIWEGSGGATGYGVSGESAVSTYLAGEVLGSTGIVATETTVFVEHDYKFAESLLSHWTFTTSDFNGDGIDDSFNGREVVFAPMRQPTVSLPATAENSLELRPLGDLNQDGFDDLIAWTHESGQAFINVIFGRDNMEFVDTIEVARDARSADTYRLASVSIYFNQWGQPRLAPQINGTEPDGGIREPYAAEGGIGFSLRDGRSFLIKPKQSGFEISELPSPAARLDGLSTDFNGDGLQDRVDAADIIFGQSGRRPRRVSMRLDRLI